MLSENVAVVDRQADRNQGIHRCPEDRAVKQESAAYWNLKAFIHANLVLITPVALVARQAFSSQHALVRWLGGGAARDQRRGHHRVAPRRGTRGQ